MTKTGAHRVAQRKKAHAEALHQAFWRRRYEATQVGKERDVAQKNPSGAGRRAQRRTFVKRQRGLSQALARRQRAERAGKRGIARKIRSLEQAHARRAYIARHRGTIGVPRTNPGKRKRKAKTMARRRSAAQIAAFKKMIAGRRKSLARQAPARGGVVVLANPRKRKRRRSRSVVVMANPRRSRRALRRNAGRMVRRRRRRNPAGGVMDAVKNVVKIGLPAILAGGSFGLLDSRLLADKSAPIRYGGKVAYALGLGLVFRKNPILAAATMGGVLGSFGSDLAAKLGGGTAAAPSTTAAVKGIGVLLREDKAAMGLLLQEMNGMGLTIDNDVSLGRMGSVGVGEDAEQFNDVNLG